MPLFLGQHITILERFHQQLTGYMGQTDDYPRDDLGTILGAIRELGGVTGNT